MHVLIVEHDPVLAADIGRYLEAQGETPDFAADGAIGIRLCEVNRYEAIVLNKEAPRLHGVIFCRLVREYYSTPIVMITSEDSTDDRIEALEAGADDCLTKPFSLRELHLRLKAIVRRPADTRDCITVGRLHMDFDQHRVFRDTVLLDVSPIGFKILELLVRSFPHMVTRAQIEEVVWKDDLPASTAALRAHIHRLRRTLEGDSGAKLIKTIHGVGYRLEP